MIINISDYQYINNMEISILLVISIDCLNFMDDRWSNYRLFVDDLGIAKLIW